MAIIDDIRRTYKQSSMLMRIIFINIGVFLCLRVLAIIAFFFNTSAPLWVQWVELPSDLGLLLRRPWTLVTYMFAHYEILHILFNMLWLYWLGRIFMEYFSSKQLMGVYLLGGWAGAVIYLLAYNLLPQLGGTNAFLIGASASVFAVIVAAAVYAPDYKIGLLFFGEVALKWVVIVVIGLELVMTPSVESFGGSIPHLGGALMGALFAMRIKQGRDITRPLNAAIDAVVSLFGGRSITWPKFGGSRAQTPNQQGKQEEARASHRPADTVSEEELDGILAKIKVAGYDALTDEERDKLFKASRRPTS